MFLLISTLYIGLFFAAFKYESDAAFVWAWVALGVTVLLHGAQVVVRANQKYAGGNFPYSAAFMEVCMLIVVQTVIAVIGYGLFYLIF